MGNIELLKIKQKDKCSDVEGVFENSTLKVNIIASKHIIDSIHKSIIEALNNYRKRSE